jgi:ACS family tartrate transporter-like MFS transporter
MSANTGAFAVSVPSAAATAEERLAFRKVMWRLLPILTTALMLNNMDRTNVGFAALMMNHDLGLTNSQFGLGAGILFASLCLLEVPSNLVLFRVGSQRWIARIMITWGILSAATAFVVGPNSFYGVRFLLGAAEAGFFPGILFLFGNWFPVNYRTRIYAWFLLSSPIASMISGPLSAAILPMNGFLGWQGWQWMFLLEGLPVVILGIMIPWIIADSPGEAKWLNPREKEVVTQALAIESREKPVERLWDTIKDIRILMLAGILFGFLLGSYGLGVWLPLILKGHGLTNTEAGLLSAVPFLIGCVVLILWAQFVDRTGRRIANLSAACLLSAIGFIISIVAPSLLTSYIGLTLAIIGITTTRGLFWAIPPRIMTGMAAAGGIAFLNTIGTFGGFLGPTALGIIKDLTGSFDAGLAMMAAVLLVSGLLAVSLRFVIVKE